MRIRPIGHRGMYLAIWEDRMDGDDWDMRTNHRKANCKVCGNDIPKGQGSYWRRCGNPENWYRFTRNYLCIECQSIWGDLAPRKVKGFSWETFIRYLPTRWNAVEIKDNLDLEVLPE